MALTSDSIKRKLAEITQVPAARWSRRAKYKVGSDIDLKNSGRPVRGLNLVEKRNSFRGEWVRILRAVTDDTQEIIIAAFGNTEIKEIWDISDSNNFVVLWPKQKSINYNVITQIGYVESSCPSMLWWRHTGAPGKTKTQLAEELRQHIIDYIVSENEINDCCKDLTPSKKQKYCPTCGKYLFGHSSVAKQADCARSLVLDLHTGSCDSLGGDHGDIRPDEYFEERGWNFWSSIGENGPLITISSFDDYVMNHPHWGKDGRAFYGYVEETNVVFGENK